jgi:hypothetical protein
MAINEILSYCETDTGTNLLTQVEYFSDAERLIGNTQFTIARSKLVNKSVKQSVAVASGLAQFAADNQPADVTDLLLTSDMSNVITHANANFRRQNNLVIYPSTGTGNNLILTTTPFPYPTPAVGTEIQFIANATNTGTTLLTLDAFPATLILMQTTTGLQGLIGGEIRTGFIYRMIFNGLNWILMDIPPRVSKLFAQVSKSTSQVVGSGSIILFDGTADFDPSGFWNGGLNRLIPNTLGVFNISCTIGYTAPAGRTIELRLRKNGLSSKTFDLKDENSECVNGQAFAEVTTIGDYFEMVLLVSPPSGTIVGNPARNYFAINFLG